MKGRIIDLYKFIIFFYHLHLASMTSYDQSCENCCNSNLTLWDDNKMVGPHGNLITPNQLTFLFSHLTKQGKWLPLSHFLFIFLTFPPPPPPPSKHSIIAIMVSSTKIFKKFNSLPTMDLLKIEKRNEKKSLPITYNPMQWSMCIF